MTPEFLIGLFLILAGTVGTAFPKPKTYLNRLINLEIPGIGILLVMLSYNEALALLTYGGVSALSVFIFVRVLQKREGKTGSSRKYHGSSPTTPTFSPSLPGHVQSSLLLHSSLFPSPISRTSSIPSRSSRAAH